MHKPIYSRFSQVKMVIQGVEAIDFFFAKEVMSALDERCENDAILPSNTIVQEANLFHLFLALSMSLRAGHSCLPLSEVAEQHWGKSYVSSNVDDPNTTAMTEEQEQSQSGFVFTSFDQLQALLVKIKIGSADQQIVVFEQDKLYMRRYYQFESDLAQSISGRLSEQCQFDNDSIRQCVLSLFPHDENHSEEDIDWQKMAVANAINKNFSVIAGGPGTGKTYTVTKLLAALVMLEQQANNNSTLNSSLNIALVAPTGKAAQRLSESIVDAIAGFKGFIADEVLAGIPIQAQTIHRLLGVIPNSPNFRHDQNKRLSYDVVLIDEVSMVDLPLMTRIFRALKDSAKVILLGDADQLPSVAAGSVLADITPRPHLGYSPENTLYLNQVCQLAPDELTHYFVTNRAGDNSAYNSGSMSSVAEHTSKSTDYLSFLVKSRRFDGKGGIGLIANAVINGDSKRSWQLLLDSQVQGEATTDNLAENNIIQHSESQLSLAQGELSMWLKPLVKQYYQPIEDCEQVGDAFALLAKFRVLCATRQGDFGVEQINADIIDYLGKTPAPHLHKQQVLYHGLPIMINQNDYRLGLYNGDIGIIWRIVDQEGKSHLMACFEQAEQGETVIRKILPSRLPQFESVYAMTIHKTQGSEFSHVAMVLSATEAAIQQGKKAESGSKLLSRELLYTGITRAKKQLTIASSLRIWQQGVIGQVKRHSGLRL